MRSQHHQDADEARGHRRPAIDAHALLEEGRRHRDGDQRRHERNGRSIDDGQPRQRQEIAEHAADADQATPDLPKRAYRTHGRRQLVPPRIDHQYRKDRKSGAEEHDLPHRIGLTEKTHQCRHHREQQRRQHLERNRLDDIHACVAPLRRAAAASSVGTGIDHVAVIDGSRSGESARHARRVRQFGLHSAAERRPFALKEARNRLQPARPHRSLNPDYLSPVTVTDASVPRPAAAI
jgi:hypothetical protein